MPFKYVVTSRDARPRAMWGFTFALPHSVGGTPPIYLPGAGTDSVEVMMGELIVGYRNEQGLMDLFQMYTSGMRTRNFPTPARNLWTGSISDCVVICVGYHDHAKGGCGHFWFQHLNGGQDDDFFEQVKEDFQEEAYANVQARYAVVAARDPHTTDTITARLGTIGVPLDHVHIYIAGTAVGTFRFGIDFSTNLFGETTAHGTALSPNAP
jgi:hypothetical protein